MTPINFGKMLTACSDPPRAVQSVPAFVHRATGDVLFIAAGDATAAEFWFIAKP